MRKFIPGLLFLTAAVMVVVVPACDKQASGSSVKKRPQRTMPVSLAQLGEQLFNDPILSSDTTISCASCNKPEFAFADNVELSFGVDSSRGTRNTPSAMNLAAREHFFYDGRAATLEEQAIGPIENPLEINLSIKVAVERLRKDQIYSAAFKRFFNAEPSPANIGAALAAFQKTLETSDTPFDRYMEGDTNAISASAQRGHMIFNEKGRCFDCHFSPDFTGDEFRNIGLYNGKDLNDAGRFEITKNKDDLCKFKVPGLRNVAVTAPYMHNGQMKTLREVIDFYDDPSKVVKDAINADSLVRTPLNLTEQEKKDLEEFLKTLTDDRFATKSK